MNEKLSGDVFNIALDFIDFMKANEMQSDDENLFKYQGENICQATKKRRGLALMSQRVDWYSAKVKRDILSTFTRDATGMFLDGSIVTYDIFFVHTIMKKKGTTVVKTEDMSACVDCIDELIDTIGRML